MGNIIHILIIQHNRLQAQHNYYVTVELQIHHLYN